MLEHTEDRDQIAAGLVFVATFVVVWPLGTVLNDKSYGLVLAAIVASIAASIYYGYRWVLRREQEIKEEIDEHRYRLERLQEELELFAEESGANAFVARVDAFLERLYRRLRRDLEDADPGDVPGVVVAVIDDAVAGELAGGDGGADGSDAGADGVGDRDRSDAARTGADERPGGDRGEPDSGVGGE